MMSDLRGFTAMSERMEPQSLLAMLNHYLGEMTEIIQRRNGTIIEFIGDGIMAIFGAPAPSDCHASDAVAAAVEMQARMEDINVWNGERGYPVLEMGVGINTGEVIVGNIGSEKRTKYGVVGSHVNLCGRIESYTVGGQVLISPKTRSMVSEPLDIAMEQEVFPKGVKTPLTLAQVTGIGGAYGVSCRQREEMPEPLACPAPVSFVAIHEKHVDAEPSAGQFTAMSRSGAVRVAEEPGERVAHSQDGRCGLRQRREERRKTKLCGTETLRCHQICYSIGCCVDGPADLSRQCDLTRSWPWACQRHRGPCPAGRIEGYHHGHSSDD